MAPAAPFGFTKVIFLSHVIDENTPVFGGGKLLPLRRAGRKLPAVVLEVTGQVLIKVFPPARGSSSGTPATRPSRFTRPRRSSGTATTCSRSRPASRQAAEALHALIKLAEMTGRSGRTAYPNRLNVRSGSDVGPLRPAASESPGWLPRLGQPGSSGQMHAAGAGQCRKRPGR